MGFFSIIGIATAVGVAGKKAIDKISETVQKKHENDKEIREIEHKNQMEKMVFESELKGKTQSSQQENRQTLKCGFCGEEISIGAKFCFNCGKAVMIKKFCTNCGMQLSEEAKFCFNCGVKVDN